MIVRLVRCGTSVVYKTHGTQAASQVLPIMDDRVSRTLLQSPGDLLSNPEVVFLRQARTKRLPGHGTAQPAQGPGDVAANQGRGCSQRIDQGGHGGAIPAVPKRHG